MFVKIIAGTFGHVVGKRVIPVKAGAAPIEVDDKVAARLISVGVAVAVEETGNPLPSNGATGTGAGTGDDGAGTDETAEFPEYSEKMTREELEAVALSVGITQAELDAAKKKADVLALLDAEKAASEGAPTFDPAGDML